MRNDNTPEDLRLLVSQLRRLADDLERITGGAGPDASDLARAPVLSAWTPVIVPTMERALAGTVHGHPLIANGHRTVTSHLVAVDPGLGWIRTWNRYYRLGAPAADIEGAGHA
ncbi:hypothetical protein RA307_02530 [Xanthobacteraceae bacterium Astr-EGSB]|uniref:DUF6634 family protein n=1 Tax=Astrobacterium formosum TaxID=3069710 RepID=UPI0027B8494D|nr:hypothetical protein [Xanthobacteraceae bacterium Astr-EGSB]